MPPTPLRYLLIDRRMSLLITTTSASPPLLRSLAASARSRLRAREVPEEVATAIVLADPDVERLNRYCRPSKSLVLPPVK